MLMITRVLILIQLNNHRHMVAGQETSAADAHTRLLDSQRYLHSSHLAAQATEG